MVAMQDCAAEPARDPQPDAGGMVQALRTASSNSASSIRPAAGLSANFEDYKLAHAFEIPEMVALIDDQDTRPVIGLAGPCVIPGTARSRTVFNACGARIRDLPMTPDGSSRRSGRSGRERDEAFRLANPTTLDQVVEILKANRQRGARSRAQVLAGGQDLLTEMKEHLAEPEVVVNLKGIGGLDEIRVDATGALAIGALARLADLEEHEGVRKHAPMLAEAARSVASPQIRSVGTVGGNLCQRPRCWYFRNEHAKCIKKGGSECFSHDGENKYTRSSAAARPGSSTERSRPALVALEARATLRGGSGERTVPREFFTLPSEGSVLQENVLQDTRWSDEDRRAGAAPPRGAPTSSSRSAAPSTSRSRRSR
jgi:CO/xanthine dehydrogenase FAD-binding subunit